jgi:DNA invertase Pin-like site-specific DNA recombinase
MISSVEQTRRQGNVEMASKIKSHHLRRKALIYVRQSTAYQVKNNQESAKLQRALKELVLQLGWEESQIELIDEDLGRSGTSREGRTGFERLLEQVGGGQVGLVMSLEVSRLCRSNRDWQMLMWLCQGQGTLLGEEEKLYDSNDLSEELFLSIKGAISAYEGRWIHRRMQMSKEAKAARGELRLPAPRGYVWEAEGLLKDPDELVRGRIELVFAQFERLGSVHRMLEWFVEQGLELPLRRRTGPNKGKLEWTRPTMEALRHILRNPFYTGAYVYGRRQVQAQLKKQGQPYSGVRELGPEQWKTFLPGHHEGYISPEQYEYNLKRLRQNSPKGLGAPRSGPSLLAGLLYCGHCGSRMTVEYSNNGTGLRYSCISQEMRHGGQRCQMLAGAMLDRAVEELLLQALEPASVELELSLLEDFEAQQRQLHRVWEQRLEEARYQASLVETRYKEHDPKNRLVTANLESDWQRALERLEKLQRGYQEFRLKQPSGLSEEMRQRIRSTCSDIPALWHAETTSPQQRQNIARLMFKRVEVLVQHKNEKALLRLHWAGGDVMELELRRTVAKLEQLSYYAPMLALVEELLGEGLDDEQIALQLGVQGYLGARGEPLSGSSVGALRRRMGWSRRAGRSGP